MEEVRLIPNKRFNGYYDEWMKCRLKDFRDESDNYSFTGGPFGSDLQSADYTEKGVRIIQLQNIEDGVFLNSYKIYKSKEKVDSLSSNLNYTSDIMIAKMVQSMARLGINPDYVNN